MVAIAVLVLDFLCIHPFRDGNGCVSRLLTLLALYQHGYEAGRYISRLCPGVSRDHIRRRLEEMRRKGLVRCPGLGPGAKWRKEGPISKEGQKEGTNS